MKGNILIGQSGGPTMVINESLVGIIKEAVKYEECQGIYGAKHGFLGILNEDFVDLRQQSDEELEKVAKTPSSALGTCRFKPSEEDCKTAFEVFEKYNIKYFFYIGGNDTAETCHIINEVAKEHNYELRVFHVPKTIDNDLKINHFCPGYPSAAQYVIDSFIGNDLDNRAMPGVKIDVVMGRHAGWLTAASCLARENEGDGPHLIYVPEFPITPEKFVEDIDAMYKKHGRVLVAVSEGVVDKNTGKSFGESLTDHSDSHGNVQLSGSGALGDLLVEYVKSHTKHKDMRVRTDTLGYAQRSFPGVSTAVDRKVARMVGQEAVKYSMKGDIDGSVAIKMIESEGEPVFETDLVKLRDVAKETQDLPENYINDEGNNVTADFVNYITKLVDTPFEKGELNDIKIEKR